MKTAIVKICPENTQMQMDIQTNGVSNLDMLESLNVLVKHFARAIVQEAEELTSRILWSVADDLRQTIQK